MIDYFFLAADSHLLGMGIDRRLVPQERIGRIRHWLTTRDRTTAGEPPIGSCETRFHFHQALPNRPRETLILSRKSISNEPSRSVRVPPAWR